MPAVVPAPGPPSDSPRDSVTPTRASLHRRRQVRCRRDEATRGEIQKAGLVHRCPQMSTVPGKLMLMATLPADRTPSELEDPQEDHFG